MSDLGRGGGCRFWIGIVGPGEAGSGGIRVDDSACSMEYAVKADQAGSVVCFAEVMGWMCVR